MPKLNKEQREILKTLAQQGVQTPLRLAIQLMEPPDKLKAAIEQLAQEDLIAQTPLESDQETPAISITRKGSRKLQSAD